MSLKQIPDRYLPFLSVLEGITGMGGHKSKPKDVGQRASLDGNLSSGGGAGGHHHSSNQQSLTPNRSPTVDGGFGGGGGQPMANNAELALFGGVDSNSLTSPNRITLSGGRGSSGVKAGRLWRALL
ncbi:unnamed protein product [Tetraodon nigroviridis]|uniref:(spotted green pufferfish) hypothetical protein n=1 Tax=Tetraodon nigroviridis TaxID=99883 RepID=Q4RAT5_TETNG|nr:unnamed protein product [Tetraodon nigroviridis]